MKRKIYFVMLCCLMLILLGGCGVSDKDKKAVFEELKKQNLIDVGDSVFEDYSEITTASNAPVPGGSSCYSYLFEGLQYYIMFDRYTDEERGNVYMTSVREYGLDYQIFMQYFFQKDAFSGKMELIDTTYGFFEKNFTEDQIYGVLQITYIGDSIYVELSKDNDACQDDSLIRYVKEALEDPDCTQAVICNIGGEKCEGQQVKVRELSDKYKISASFPQAEHTQLISWQMGDVVLDGLNER